MRKNILKIYGGLLIAALIYLAYYYLIGSTIPCFYLSNYGIQCPGCGLTRMMFALMRLDFAAAFSYNPVGFVAMMVWNAVAVLCFWGKVEFVKKPVFLYTLLAISLASFLVFGFVRNFT
jgi:hypothetical protein